MKKSEKQYIAMLCVRDSAYSEEIRLDVLKLLMDERDTALFIEKREEEKEDKE